MANYYVDATLGGDGGTGEIGDPWKTISKVQATLNGDQSDDTAYFKCGEVWRESYAVAGYGTSGHLFTHGQYGSGDDPIIMGSNLLTSWTQVGSTDVWYSTEPSTDLITIWLDGLSYWQAANAGVVDVTDRWYYSGGTVWVYATSDPSTFYSISGVEAPTRSDAIYCNKDYVRLENLHIKYGLNYTLRIHTGADSCEAVNLTIDGAGNYAAFQLNGTSNCTVDNCIINGDSKPDQNNGLYLDWGTSNTVKNCTIRNGSHCTVFIRRCVGTIFEYNEVYCEFEFGRTIAVQRNNSVGSANIVRYNYFHGSQSDDTPHADSGAQWSGQDEEVYYNIFSGTQERALQLWSSSGSTKNNNFYNNVFYGFDDRGVRINTQTIAGSDNNVFKNNILFGNDSTNHYQVSLKNANDVNNAIFINNVIFDSATSSTVEQAGTPRTVAYMETNYPSLWSDNIVADPSFTDAANDDFTLQAGSPCIDAGVDVGLTEDYDGVSVPQETYPAIGAFEYVGIQIISAVGNIPSTEAFGGSLLYFLNRLYDKGREAFLGGDIDFANDTIKAVLVDSADYTLNLTTHEFLDDIPSAAQVAISDALTGKSVTLGIADASDITIATVSGDKFEYIILFKDTGDSATSPLIMCIDSAVGLPFTPEGGSVILKWSDLTSKIFKL